LAFYGCKSLKMIPEGLGDLTCLLCDHSTRRNKLNSRKSWLRKKRSEGTKRRQLAIRKL
jgi:hypothetical protein